jgi:prepilin peptidase CpaA
LIRKTGDLIFSSKQRGMRSEPEKALADSLRRKMPYAPAIAIGTLLSFFAR